VNGVRADCAAVNGTGSASNQAGTHSCERPVWHGADAHCIAASGTGEATNDAGAYSCHESGMTGIRVEVGCIAASGTNEAKNNTDSCSSGPRVTLPRYVGEVIAEVHCLAASGPHP
jgi:hypothetical protein